MEDASSTPSQHPPPEPIGVIDVYESHGGPLGGGPFHYVIEGDRLVHLGKYALNQVVSATGLRYQIPLRNLRDIDVYQFQLSKTGYLIVTTTRPQDFEHGHARHPVLVDPWPESVQRLRFQVDDPDTARLHQQYWNATEPMARRVASYAKRLGATLQFVRNRRLEQLIQDPAQSYFAALCPPDATVRSRVLHELRHRVYPLWVLAELCEAWDVFRFLKRPWETQPSWTMDRGGEHSALIAETPRDAFSFWHTFEPHPGEMLAGVALGRQTGLQPDWVMVRGTYARRKDLERATGGFEAIVVCQDRPFAEWSPEVENRLLTLRRTYRPRRFILASLLPIPAPDRRRLVDQGMLVLDDFGPQSTTMDQVRGRLAATNGGSQH